MKITCWGVRGSIPVSGAEYTRYGGDTTCFEVQGDDGTRLILDAGTGIRVLGKRLIEEQATECHLLLTHTHWDHIIGLTAFAPIFLEDLTITVPVLPSQMEQLERSLETLFTAPTFPVPFTRVNQRLSFEPVGDTKLTIGSLKIDSIPISHPNGGLGYRITEEEKSLVFLTDNELGMVHPGGVDMKEYAQFVKGCDLLLHDAEYTPEEYEPRRGWGHSSWPDALTLAQEAGVKRLGFIHHNADHSDATVDAMVEACRHTIRRKGLALTCFAVSPGTPMTL